MDLQQAISSHARWKKEIASFNEGKLAHGLDPSVIARGDVCEIGRWLTEQQPLHRTLPEYVALKRVHARFHSHAAQLVIRVASGEKVANSELETGSEYGRLSAEVVNAIKALWSAIERP